MRARAARLLLALTILLGSACSLGAPAASARSLTAAGDVDVREGALDLVPLGAYLNGTHALQSFELTASTVHVIVFTRFSAHAAGESVQAPPEFKERTYRNATVVLSAPYVRAHGWLGYYPEPGASFAVDGNASLSARRAGTLGNASVPPEHVPLASRDFYARAFPDPHLLLAASGDFAATGPGGLKVHGLNVTIRADGVDEERVPTGRHQNRPSPVRMDVWATLYWDSSDARFTMRTLEPLAIAAERLEGTATGLWLQVLNAPDGPQPLRMAGDARAPILVEAWPGTSLDHEVALLNLHVEGGLGAGTDAGSLSGLVRRAPPDLAAAILLASLALCVVLAVLLLRARRRPRPDPVDALRMAREAARGRDYDAALAWYREARRPPAPWTDAVLEEARLLHEAGRAAAALRLVRRAARRTESGSAEYLASRFLLLEGRTADAERWLLRGLQKNPRLAFEVQSNPEYDALARQPRVREHLSAAIDAMGGA